MKKTLLICVLLCLFTNNHCIRAGENTKTEQNLKIDSTLNEKNVYIALIINNIKYPEVVLSQIIIETGNFTSKLCKRNNNLIGMTVPFKRATTALNKNGYAKYSNWLSSIIDYKLYQEYIFSKNKILNKKQYINFLHKKYASSPNYKHQLTILSEKYELRNTYNIGSL